MPREMVLALTVSTGDAAALVPDGLANATIGGGGVAGADAEGDDPADDLMGDDIADAEDDKEGEKAELASGFEA